MSGQVRVADHMPITFSSMVGVIRDRDVYFVYENLAGERGLVFGKVISDTPTEILFEYRDLYGFDKNGDPGGYLTLSR